MLRFRPLVTDDFPLLLEWLSKEHVKQWWDDGDNTLEQVVHNYGEPEEGLERFILVWSHESGERPIGYFQYYLMPDGAIGIDQFIGEEEFINRGLGTDAIRMFVEMIRHEHKPASVILDPSPENKRAIRCYEKAGFKHYETKAEEEGPAYMMRLEVSSLTPKPSLILLAVLVLLTFTAGNHGSLSAQQHDAGATGQLNRVDLKVNNVGLNASYDEVLQRLGVPERTRKEKATGKSCGPPHTSLALYYPGLKVELYGTLAGRNFRVVSIEITSSDWETARGMRVGMEETDVRERLGKPEIDYADSGGRALIYKLKDDPAVVALIIKGGRSVSIESALPCSKRKSSNSLNRTRD